MHDFALFSKILNLKKKLTLQNKHNIRTLFVLNTIYFALDAKQARKSHQTMLGFLAFLKFVQMIFFIFSDNIHALHI